MLNIDSLADKLRRRGMTINTPDGEPFRRKLQTGGFYAKWQQTFGTQAWSLLEQTTGPLA